MSQHGTIRRYSLVIEKIGQKHYPSFFDIKHYLYDHGFEISDRTLQRDIEQIRMEFGLEIRYDRGKKGYYIDRNRSVNPESFLRFLEIVSTAELLVESLMDGKEALDHIVFEDHGNLKRIENLKPLLFAVRNHRMITFNHENFHSGQVHEFRLYPYMLKEYQNRWYVVGNVGPGEDLFSFGIERIFDLKVLTETFKPDKGVRPRALFDHVIGLTYSKDDPQRIVLSFTAVQGKYVKSLPWHTSQEILVDDEKECRIELYLVPNYEFRQKVLKHIDSVKVLEPVWLKDEIRDLLRKRLEEM